MAVLVRVRAADDDGSEIGLEIFGSEEVQTEPATQKKKCVWFFVVLLVYSNARFDGLI